MSVNVECRTDDPGSDTHLEAAWDLKERIREREGVLKQRRGFFTEAYRRSRTNLRFVDGDLVGFASTRRDGYMLFLAVAPGHRGEGHGGRLVAAVADDHRSVTCHARTTNEGAIEFYRRIGFEVTRRVDGYYEDGGDAYYLKLGADGGLRDRLREFVS